MERVEGFEDAGVPAVRGFLHLPEQPSGDGLVLTHGAGSSCRTPLLTAVAAAFASAGIAVLRCDLPFRQARPHGPPPRGSGPTDRAGLGRAVAALRQRTPGCLMLGGHSYGGRQASLLAAQMPDIADVLLLLSYPLHPPGRPAALRTAHFAALRTPALFVHGDRDPFGTLQELETALTLIPAPTGLVAVPGAGHDLGAIPSTHIVRALLALRQRPGQTLPIAPIGG